MGIAEQAAVRSKMTTHRQLAEVLEQQPVKLARLSAVSESRCVVPNGVLEKATFISLAAPLCQGRQRSVDLAESIYADPSTVSRQVTASVTTGMVQRRPDPLDRRSRVLAPTDLGKRAFERVRGRRNSSTTQVIQSWDLSDGQRLFGLHHGHGYVKIDSSTPGSDSVFLQNPDE